MSRMKSILAVMFLAAIAIPMAHAAAYVPTTLWISGSSAMWQTMALGAYSSGNNFITTSPNKKTCHYTSGANFTLTDTRNSQNVADGGTTWVVWSVVDTGVNSCANSVTNNDGVVDIWVYESVDSVVGVRCYFAAPSCLIAAPASFPAVGNKIGSALWGDSSTDTLPSAAVQAFLQAGARQNVAATDIRPEDAAFAECRVNSPLGNSTVSGTGGTQDGLDGLGYSQLTATQGSGRCPAFSTAINQDNINGIGLAIKSGYPGSSKKANVVAFNITGNDPLTNTKVTAYTTYPVGAAPIVFVANNTNGSFTGATSATERQLQTLFSGTNCDASVLQGAAGGPINVFLREPLSGTYNTTEATVMRYPTAYGTGGAGVTGTSMETGVGLTTQLTAAPCGAGGMRYRGIGTGEEVLSVHDSANGAIFTGGNNRDGIGFTFFSYGNVSTLADQANYSYFQLNGVDPIFASYSGKLDPGQNATAGTVPGVADVPGAAFPACENKIWKGGLSFPNVRNGSYRAWSSLRLVSTGTNGTNAGKLITASNKYVVTTVPDYVPAVKVALPAVNTCAAQAFTDPGFGLVRSHYVQKDGNGAVLGGTTAVNQPSTAEKGGDMGGMIIPLSLGVVTKVPATLGENQTQTVQSSSTTGGLGPVARP